MSSSRSDVARHRPRPIRRSALAAAVAAFAACAPAMAAWCPDGKADHQNEIPRFDHILVIIAENHAYRQIIGNPHAPNINRLATSYGLATRYYGVVHPSKANYIAMIGGDTFGIHDDDAYYCKAGSTDRFCEKVDTDTNQPYVDHTITGKSLIDQLAERNFTWKAYLESIPSPGSKVVYFPDPATPLASQPTELYASKHNAFINFKSGQDDPDVAGKFVGFDQLFEDLARGQLPNYAHVVPNQCNDMHGRSGPNVPDDCDFDNDEGRIARGDRTIRELVAAIQASPIWSAPGNSAIVITWDEDDDPHEKTGIQGCCGYDPNSAANFGGGHIATIVITNHGPRGITDDTPHNHYSLLRTTEDAFCIREYLGHAKDADVVPMTKLFQGQ